VFHWLNVSINIMLLAGIILALGDMVDSAVVLVENAHKRIEEAESQGVKTPRIELVLGAVRELGPSMFGALLVLTVAFLPVFALQGEEGRLFRPLALAKTFSMAFAALFSITLVPALMVTCLKGRIVSERNNPINRLCMAAYRPLLTFSLRFRYAIVGAALALLGLTALPFLRLGSEFMPPLYEGDLLYMPISVPGISIQEAQRLLQRLDGEIAQVPEVKRVFGKTGRAETSRRCRCSRSWCNSSPRTSGVRASRRSRSSRSSSAAPRLRACRAPGRCPSRHASTCSRRASVRR
jgi:Cu(I)/Ag(I) efflux system membrane protein CusA/SilA